MAEQDAQPRKTLRGTWDQIRGHSDEIPNTTEVEVRVEEDLREFKRNLNLPRKEAGARLHYPEVE